jgi:hypothetical protein
MANRAPRIDISFPPPSTAGGQSNQVKWMRNELLKLRMHQDLLPLTINACAESIPVDADVKITPETSILIDWRHSRSLRAIDLPKRTGNSN